MVHASDTCSSTDSTVAANNRSLKDFGIEDFQMLLSLLHARYAATLRCLMSFAVLAIQAPKYLKSCASSTSVPSFVLMFIVLFWLYLMNFVFLVFIFNPSFATDVWTLWSSSCAWCIFSDSSTISSAKSRSVTISGPILLLLRLTRWKSSASSLPPYGHYQGICIYISMS